MNSQNGKEGSGRDRTAIIAGIFIIIGACITGAFLIFNTLIEKGAIVIVPSPESTALTEPSPISPPTDSPVATITLPTVANPPTPTPNQCQWLQTNFPQTADNAKAQYNLPSDTTFQFIYELCPSIANAFAFKANSTVEIQVPSGGCIDSWSGFTKYVGDAGTPVEDGHGGWRVYKGIVRAPEMTIRILGCK